MSNIVFTFKSISASSSCVSGMQYNDEKIIIIPSKDISGIPVTRIGRFAFGRNRKIEEVVIPDSVKVIEAFAFFNCSNLKKITLPNALSEIGEHAFERCDIEKLILPKVDLLNFAAFSKNKNGIFTIKEEIKTVKSNAFNECRKVIFGLDKGAVISWDDDWDGGVKEISDYEENITETASEESDDLNDVKENEKEDFNDLTNRQNLFDQSVVDGVKGIVYAKALKLSFPVKNLLISKIPILQSARLTFYQKFIILLLEKGVRANDSFELIDYLSNTLNISRICVEDFVKYLIENSNIHYDKKLKKYSLGKEIHFTIKPELNNAMFAELDIKMAECNRIIYLDKINKCYLEDDFDNGAFRKKGNSSNVSSLFDENKMESIKSHKDEILDLLTRHYSKTNMHVKREYPFDLTINTFADYTIEFDALLQYQYNEDRKESKLFNTIVLKENFLPKDYIDFLADEYKIDKKLPRFLEIKEQFYDEVLANSTEIDRVESCMETTNETIMPLEADIEAAKISLSELKKANKKTKEVAENSVGEVKEKIKSKEEEISINESLVNKSSNDDKNLIDNLKKTIISLKKDKENLENELASKIKEVEEYEIDSKNREDILKKSIDEKKEALSKALADMKIYEKELKSHKSTLTSLLTKNKGKTSEIIKSVIQKYPADENMFNRYVTDIVVWLDSALSASECNAVDEVGRCIDTIREMYRKVLQIIFDTLLNKKEMTLGSYMSDSFNQIELEKLFKSRGVNNDIKQRLVAYHDISNAFGHLAENGPKKSHNEEIIAEFKKMSPWERNRIILAIPEFFDSISFTGKEKKSFTSRLSIK